MLGAVIAVVATIVKAALTGIGLATGFAIVGGVPGVFYKIVEFKEKGIPAWRAIVPPWMFAPSGVETHTESFDEQQFNAAGQPS